MRDVLFSPGGKKFILLSRLSSQSSKKLFTPADPADFRRSLSLTLYATLGTIPFLPLKPHSSSENISSAVICAICGTFLFLPVERNLFSYPGYLRNHQRNFLLPVE